MEGSLSKLSKMKPGGHPLRREVVVGHQRDRILAATVAVVAAKGYRSVSVAAIVAEAGVSRLKFYENFGSKEDAFLAAFDAGLDLIGVRLAAVLSESDDDPAARVRGGVDAVLELILERPDLARFLVVEAPLLGPAIFDRRDPAADTFAPLLEHLRRAGGGEIPAGTEEAVLDGLFWLLYDALLPGRSLPSAELRPAMIEFALLPFLGPSASRRATDA